MKTSCGEIRIKLDQADNPKTANAFASLVRANYYDGLVFHRVVKGWVVQSGDPFGADPTRAGSGGPSWQVVEAPPSDAQYTRGVVAMAKTATDPDGASRSQFFIVVGQDAGLPPQYAIAGKVKIAARWSTRSATSAPTVRMVRRAAPPSSRRPTSRSSSRCGAWLARRCVGRASTLGQPPG